MRKGGDEGILLWGATGQAKVVAPILARAGLSVLAVCDRNPDVAPPFEGTPIFHDEPAFLKWLEAQDTRRIRFVAAIGGTHGRQRLAVDRYLTALALEPISAIHPTASIEPSTQIGEGSQVCALAAISVECKIGRQCIVNTNATVEHEVSMGDGVHVMPGATVLGSTEIGDGASIGSNATVLPRLRIGPDSIVGAGAVVTRSVPEQTVVMGIPARAHARRECGQTPANPWHVD